MKENHLKNFLYEKRGDKMSDIKKFENKIKDMILDKYSSWEIFKKITKEGYKGNYDNFIDIYLYYKYQVRNEVLLNLHKEMNNYKVK